MVNQEYKFEEQKIDVSKLTTIRKNEEYYKALSNIMSVLPDYEIDRIAKLGAIENYVPNLVREQDNRKIISYGLSSYGYDVRLSNKFKIFSNINHGIIDPIQFDDSLCVDYEGEYCIIPPNSYILGVTVEKFNIPDDIIAICVGKSSYARCGAIVNVTPIEPGFEGEVVIEIANSTPLPIKVYANMGIAQFIFFRGPKCEVTYRDRKGKYQGQTGITTAKV